MSIKPTSYITGFVYVHCNTVLVLANNARLVGAGGASTRRRNNHVSSLPIAPDVSSPPETDIPGAPSDSSKNVPLRSPPPTASPKLMTPVSEINRFFVSEAAGKELGNCKAMVFDASAGSVWLDWMAILTAGLLLATFW